VTDEQSGLLKRASYLDLLMAEARRNAQQSTPLTVLLMQFGEKSALLREFGESAVEALMQQIGQLFAANIRQNDLAFATKLLRLPSCSEKPPKKKASWPRETPEATNSSAAAGETTVPHFNAGLAEAVLRVSMILSTLSLK